MILHFMCRKEGDALRKDTEISLYRRRVREILLRVNIGVKRIIHMIEGTGRSVDNGVHEIYANLEYPAENNEMTRLLNYISDTNGTTETTGFENLAKRVNYLKNEPGGVQYMCETLERERTEGRVEGDFFRLIKTVKNMKKKGMGVVEIADLLAEETGYIEKVLSFTEKAGTEDIQEVYQCMMDDV